MLLLCMYNINCIDVIPKQVQNTLKIICIMFS